MLYRELGILPYIGALYNLASGAGDLNEIMDWGWSHLPLFFLFGQCMTDYQAQYQQMKML